MNGTTSYSELYMYYIHFPLRGVSFVLTLGTCSVHFAETLGRRLGWGVGRSRILNPAIPDKSYRVESRVL